MPTCTNCDEFIPEGVPVCPHCSNLVVQIEKVPDFKPEVRDFNRTNDSTNVEFGLKNGSRLDQFSLGTEFKEDLLLQRGYVDFEVIRRINGLRFPLRLDTRGGVEAVLDSGEEEWALVISDKGGNRRVPLEIDPEETGLCALRILSGGGAVVCDRDGHRLMIFSAEGRLIRTIGTEGKGPGELDCPEDVVVLPNGQLVVADTENHRIQLFSQQGESLSRTPDFEANEEDLEGNEPGRFSSPVGIVVLPNGGFAVLESGNCRVQIFNSAWEYSYQFGEEGPAPSFFEYPRFLAVNPAGFFFVGDKGGKRIQKFDPMGAFIYALQMAADDEISCANFAALDKDDLLVVWKKERTVALIRKA